MPIPKPNNNETRNEFMERCITFLINEGRNNEQAIAICSTQWAENEKKKIVDEKMKIIKSGKIVKK